jgi:predicted nucleic acid-binding protein
MNDNVLLRNKIADKAIQQSINEILEGALLISLSIETVKYAWQIREKYQYSYYDCMVIASALESNCKILYSEDLQHNQLINKKLRIINPFIETNQFC